MKKSKVLNPQNQKELKDKERALVEKITGGKNKKYARFVLAALGSIPWVGGILGATSGLSAERGQEKINELQKLWLLEHQEKIKELGITLQDIFSRFDNFGEEIEKRIESQEYLTLVRKTFRSWDEADTQGKRQMLSRLLTNAGAVSLCPDDLVRLFINWIDQYHEAHFLVIKEIYQNPSITRGQIYDIIHSERPREDSSEADLFKYLIRDLSTGGVIRQERQINEQGEFLKKSSQTKQTRGYASRVMESAFEDTKPYVLTELGKKFVHYVMKDVVPQIKN